MNGQTFNACTRYGGRARPSCATTVNGEGTLQTIGDCDMNYCKAEKVKPPPANAGRKTGPLRKLKCKFVTNNYERNNGPGSKSGMAEFLFSQFTGGFQRSFASVKCIIVVTFTFVSAIVSISSDTN